MRQSLVLAIQAIERADEGADVSGLVAFCTANGIDESQVKELTEMSGPTDLGRLTLALGPEEEPEPEEAVEDGDASEGSEEPEDTGSDELSES